MAAAVAAAACRQRLLHRLLQQRHPTAQVSSNTQQAGALACSGTGKSAAAAARHSPWPAPKRGGQRSSSFVSAPENAKSGSPGSALSADFRTPGAELLCHYAIAVPCSAARKQAAIFVLAPLGLIHKLVLSTWQHANSTHTPQEHKSGAPRHCCDWWLLHCVDGMLADSQASQNPAEPKPRQPSGTRRTARTVSLC